MATDTRLAMGAAAAAVVLAAAGLLVFPGAALGTSCELTVSVNENIEEASQLHEVVDIGVFETEVVASSPALLWFKDPVRYEAPVRSWGVAPERWSGIKGQGGGFFDGYWICEEPPSLGDHRFFVVRQYRTGQSLELTTGPAGGETVADLRVSLDARFGPSAEHDVSTFGVVGAWIAAWWVHITIPGVVAAAWIHRRGRRREPTDDRGLRRGPALVAAAATVVAFLPILPHPVNLVSTPQWAFGIVAVLILVAVFAARRFDVITGAVAAALGLLVTELMFHPLEDTWRRSWDAVPAGYLYGALFVIVTLGAYRAARPQEQMDPAPSALRSPNPAP